MRTNMYTVLLFTAVILSNFLGATSAPIPGIPESSSVAREAHEGSPHQDNNQTPRWYNAGEQDSYSAAGIDFGEAPPQNKYVNNAERILIKKDSDSPSASPPLPPVRRSRAPRDRSNDIPAKRSPSSKGAQESSFDISGFANKFNTTVPQTNTDIRNETTPGKTPAHAERDSFNIEEWEEDSVGVARSVDGHIDPGTTSGARISKKEESGDGVPSGTRKPRQQGGTVDTPGTSTSKKGPEGSASGGSSRVVLGNGRPRLPLAPGPVKLPRVPPTTEKA